MRKKLDLTIAGHDVVFSRRKGTKSLKISLKSDNSIMLTAPFIVSEKRAVEFLLSKKTWIEQHIKPVNVFEESSLLGKGGRVVVEDTQVEQASVRLRIFDVVVKLSPHEDLYTPFVQKKIAETADKSIKKQAEILLTQRIKQLSQKHDIAYTSVAIRKLKSRWGSCDYRNNITLNMYLIQLEWELIDYVIVHELSHTIHHHHQSEFWQEVEKHCPDFKTLRKKLKNHKTTAFAQ